MNADLQAYLDGEKRLDELDPEARAEAEVWDRMVAAAREEELSEEAPAWIETAVMSEISAMPAHARGSARGRESFMGWMTRPRTVTVTPLAGALTAAAVALLLLWPRTTDTPQPFTGAGSPGEVVAQIYVEFSLRAPGATSVAVAGDFTGWESRYTLEDVDGDGVWTTRVPVEPGLHEYMFVIDGSEWVTDPEAERYRDDGFGNRNAVLAVSQSM